MRYFSNVVFNWVSVIWAVLPQLLARFTQGSKTAFLLYLFEPLLFVCVIYAVRGFIRQNTPDYGTSLFLFYASGFLPYFLFMRVSSRMQSVRGDSNSLFPGVSALDAFLATAILDTLFNAVTIFFVFAGMWLYGIDEARPASIADCLMSFSLLFVLGIGVGMINNVVGRFLPLWRTVYAVLTRGLIFLSGVIVIVDLARPMWVRDIMIVNPLSHAIEWFRLGVYGRYPDNSLDKTYLMEWALIALFLGFVIDRALIRQSANR